MNICLVSTLFTPEDGGGIGTYLLNLSIGLKELGHNIYLLTKTLGRESEEEISGIKVFRYKPRYLPKIESYFPGLAWSYFIAKKLDFFAKKYKIDIFEFPNWEGPGAIYLFKKNRIPVVVRLHTPFFETLLLDKKNGKFLFGDRFACWLEKKSCFLSDCLTSSTYFHGDLIANTYGIKKERIEIIPLGILAPKLHVLTSRNIGRKKLKILYVSRLENRKGTLMLLQSIPKVTSVFSDIEFIFVGKDRPHAPGNLTFKEYFEKQFPQYRSQVIFLGYLSEDKLEKYYSECDIFVVPSFYESFGLIYVEAMFYGKPIVACRAGGIPEVIEDGKTGILVEPNNVQALSDAILTLCENQLLREEMGKNAKNAAFKRFHYMIMAERTALLYNRVIKKFNFKND